MGESTYEADWDVDDALGRWIPRCQLKFSDTLDRQISEAERVRISVIWHWPHHHAVRVPDALWCTTRMGGMSGGNGGETRNYHTNLVWQLVFVRANVDAAWLEGGAAMNVPISTKRIRGRPSYPTSDSPG